MLNNNATIGGEDSSGIHIGGIKSRHLSPSTDYWGYPWLFLFGEPITPRTTTERNFLDLAFVLPGCPI